MAFENLAKQTRKAHFYRIEIDIEDSCSLTYGDALCGATGSIECYNTVKTCQVDVCSGSSCHKRARDYPATKTYSFCSSISPLPLSMPNSNPSTIPSVQSVNTAPSIIDITGGLGVRASATVVLSDHPHSDIGVDEYVANRGYNPSDRGSFWSKFKARNPYYKNSPVRIKTGFIENGVYSEPNFVFYRYVLDNISVKNGIVSVVCKDVLKLADNKKAQAPTASSVKLTLDASTSDTVLTVNDASTIFGATYVRIGAEIIFVTGVNYTLNELAVVRAGPSNNYQSTLESHSVGDTVQNCLEYSGVKAHVIAEDLLVNYANVDPSFIDSAQWQAEVDANAPTGLSTLITEPVGVNALLKELGQAAAFYLHWDAKAQLIRLTNIKQPPESATVLTDDADILDLSIKDDEKARISTVFVYFGQKDYTKKLDEVNNYAITYVREDSDSVANYGRQIETIYSRFITDTNSVAATNMAARLGRRFSDVPKKINFSLDVKNSRVTTGNTVFIEHYDIVDFTGEKLPTAFQVLSTDANKSVYKYQGLEYVYGPSLPQDADVEDPNTFLLAIASDRTEPYNIKTEYDAIYGQPLDATKTVKLLIEDNVTQGSNSVGTPAITTGSGFNGATVLIENRSFIVGRGSSGYTSPTDTPPNGGVAIKLEYPITLNNLGVIGGGGGAGGAAVDVFTDFYGNTFNVFAVGGGGAGSLPGITGYSYGGDDASSTEATDGSLTAGGDGASQSGEFDVDEFSNTYEYATNGGTGGALGGAGDVASADTGGDSWQELPPTQGGLAIETNGNAITYANTGGIRGGVV